MKLASEIKENGMIEGEDFSIILKWATGIHIQALSIFWDIEDDHFKFETTLTLKNGEKLMGTLEFKTYPEMTPIFFRTKLLNYSNSFFTLYTKSLGCAVGRDNFEEILKIARTHDDAKRIKEINSKGLAAIWIPVKAKDHGNVEWVMDDSLTPGTLRAFYTKSLHRLGII